ncbi:hypothetical protein K7X08_000523 [Anisodus acutangulus]|uniref:F-box/LRR-repeat protein 15-like leucin rich repeat domain-containing protein n=1 Tax=Anisodus acutangulus TaxID=402998 RepID=A0A9Q1RB11_9SOLA|nr:hypothetical protein K7X08_000523 [Anisodus acutangulus]
MKFSSFLSDMSLVVIGHYDITMTDITLIGFQNINERGFWVMGNGQGLQKLRSLAIIVCKGVTDLGLQALGKGCPKLRLFCLRECIVLSDNGLVAFAKGSGALENLQLEELDMITQSRIYGDLLNCVGRLCPKLTHLKLNDLVGITNEGLFPLVQNCEVGSVKVNLSGCVNVTDRSVSAITESHGESLEFLNVDGCRYVTDATLLAISNNCRLLYELDILKYGIND